MDFSLFGGGIDVLPELEKDSRDYGHESDLKDILDMSLEESGLSNCLGEILVSEKGSTQLPSWGDDTDEFLRSMLTGSELSPEVELGLHSSDAGLSDTSSDSGVVEDPCRRAMLSPGLDDGPSLLTTTSTSNSGSSVVGTKNLNLVDYISCSADDDMSDVDPMLTADPLMNLDRMEPVKVELAPVISQSSVDTQKSMAPTPAATLMTSKVTSSTPVTLVSSGTATVVDPLVSTTTGTTTIILPAIGAHAAAPIGMTFTSHRLAPRDPGPVAKRRRVSASSTDSGLEDNKYPRLEMSEEELKMAAKEGMVFPKYYPLTREEERNLKKIRRKIRNKLSAQDSRKRKREYLDSMEDRVKLCNDENEQLREKIQALETQNKTLAAQLRRLHQMVVSGGAARHGGQTSTALMVLLLSTALFLIPGLSRDQDAAAAKAEIDIQAAVKMPPLPGQSRSLLHFTQDTNAIADLNDFTEEEVKVEPVSPLEETKGSVSPPQMDHDYATLYSLPATGIKAEPGKIWIEQDAPPMGYGRGVQVRVDDEDRQMNVNVTSSGQGTRTVVLQIPKGIQ